MTHSEYQAVTAKVTLLQMERLHSALLMLNTAHY